MAEEYMKQRERQRSRSVRRAKSLAKSKNRQMTPLEKHNLLTATVTKLGHDMSVFHLRWVPGDYLDEEILNSVPMFWFKKFGWRPEDIKVLYAVGEMAMSPRLVTEMSKVYGKKNDKSGKQRKSGRGKKHILLQGQNDATSPTGNDEEALFLRTKRLKKQNVSSKNVFGSRKNSTSVSRSASKSKDGHDPLYPINLTNQGSIGLGGRGSGVDASDSDRERNGGDTQSGLRMPRNTHSFSSNHRRQSSMSNRRPSLVESGELIWSKLAATRGDTLNRRQFDIELQNNNILVDPDVSASMFDVLRDYKDVKTITKADLLRIYPQLDNIPLKDEIEDPQSLPEKEKILIVLKQVLYHVMSHTPFDVNDYLTPKLRAKDLSDPQKIIKALGSREKDWRIRLQIMEWITANMEEESGSHLEQLTTSHNLGPFLLGWMTQCLDERSNLAKAALYMFPEVYGLTLTHNMEAFGYLNDIMKSLFSVLRNKRSEQLSSVADQTAIELIEMIMEWHQNDQLDNEVLLELCEIFRDNTSMKEQKHGKVRERCCAYFGYILYGLDTTVEQTDKSMIVSPSPQTDLNVINEDKQDAKKKGAKKGKNAKDAKKGAKGGKSGTKSGSASDSKEDEKEKEKETEENRNERKITIKISKTMRRKYLLDKEAQFTGYMSQALEHTTADKEENVRNVAFKLMSKLEKSDETLLTTLFKEDPYTMKRFEKYKNRKAAASKKGKKRTSTISAVKQAREKALQLKRQSTPNGSQVKAAKSSPMIGGGKVEKSMD